MAAGGESAEECILRILGKDGGARVRGEERSFAFDGQLLVAADGFLSEEECVGLTRLMDEAKAPTVAESGYPASHRECFRLRLRSEAVGGVLWDRARGIVEKWFGRVEVGWEDVEERVVPEACLGAWRPVGLGKDGRLIKYLPGGHFSPHFDMCNGPDDTGRASMLTLMVYLNAGFGGGATEMLSNAKTDVEEDGGRVVPTAASKVGAFKPEKAGVVVVFRQGTLLHCGAPVTEGTKYLLRFDVWFEKVKEE